MGTSALWAWPTVLGAWLAESGLGMGGAGERVWLVQCMAVPYVRTYSGIIAPTHVVWRSF